MLTNLNKDKVNVQNFKDFDVAVVGAGAAGITITNHLALLGYNVALIEAGDYEYTDESQEVYTAKIVKSMVLTIFTWRDHLFLLLGDTITPLYQ